MQWLDSNTSVGLAEDFRVSIVQSASEDADDFAVLLHDADHFHRGVRVAIWKKGTRNKSLPQSKLMNSYLPVNRGTSSGTLSTFSK